MADYWTTPKTNWIANDGIGYEDLNRIEANVSANRDGNFRKVQGFGYTMTNAEVGYDGIITVNAGSCYSTNGVPIRSDSAIIKNLTTWAQGSGNDKGGVASAVTVAAITWYYIFVIMDPTDGSVDIMLDDNVAGTNISSGIFTEKRRIGAIKTALAGGSGSFDLIEMYSIGDRTIFNTVNTYLGTTFSNSVGVDDNYQTATLSAGSGLPLPALEVRADLNIISDKVNWGLVSRFGNFTVPTNLMTAGEPMGELCNKTAGGIETMDASIMIDAENKIELAQQQGSPYDGSVEIRVRGFYDERLI